MDLTPAQTEILRSLVDLFDDEPVKGKAIAGAVDRTPETIRNRMPHLINLGLVESFAGPYGGYKPTDAAYRELDIDRIDREVAVPVYREGNPLQDVVVEEIDFPTVFHPDQCRAEMYVRGSIDGIHEGDRITVGPTPRTGLVIEGLVVGVTDPDNVIILDVTRMEAPAGERTSEREPANAVTINGCPGDD